MEYVSNFETRTKKKNDMASKSKMAALNKRTNGPVAHLRDLLIVSLKVR